MADDNNWMRNLGLGAGLGQLGGGIAGMFGLGKGKNPADSANEYLNRIPGAMNPYYKPYQDAGKDAMGDLKGRYGNLMDNPGDIFNKLGQGYKESPGYQRALQAALGAGSNAQAAGGMLGTPQHEQQNMQIASDMQGKDFEQYMQHMLGMYGAGLGGEEGINKMGYGANTDYGNMLGTLLGKQGEYAYNGQAGENQGNQMNWNNIFGGLGGLLGWL